MAFLILNHSHSPDTNLASHSSLNHGQSWHHNIKVTHHAMLDVVRLPRVEPYTSFKQLEVGDGKKLNTLHIDYTSFHALQHSLNCLLYYMFLIS